MSQISPTRIGSKTGEQIIFDDSAKTKIAKGHPEMDGYLWVVEEVAKDPMCVCPSVRFHNCQAYVAYGVHPRYPSRYITVIVEVDPKPARVKTAYSHPHLKGWQKGGYLYERS